LVGPHRDAEKLGADGAEQLEHRKRRLHGFIEM
jgi:hypothetical protein